MLTRVEHELGRFGRDAAGRRRRRWRTAVRTATARGPRGPHSDRTRVDRPVPLVPAHARLGVARAVTDLSVILLGETGTGKELLARAIHDQSDRADRPFLAVNCGALRRARAVAAVRPPQGRVHRRHTPTASASSRPPTRGTLFLDEIGELPADVQVTLPALPRERRLPPPRRDAGAPRRRTHRRRHSHRPAACGRRRSFRADLFYRVHEIEIAVAPLRERREDDTLLARHFSAPTARTPSLDFDATAVDLLLAHDWPGNVRELENTIAPDARAAAGERCPAEALHARFPSGDAERRSARRRCRPESCEGPSPKAIGASPRRHRPGARQQEPGRRETRRSRARRCMRACAVSASKSVARRFVTPAPIRHPLVTPRFTNSQQVRGRTVSARAVSFGDTPRLYNGRCPRTCGSRKPPTRFGLSTSIDERMPLVPELA